MHLTGPITGTVILPVKDGVNLDNVVLDDATGSSNSSSDNGSSAASIFAHLANTLKAQPGLRRQYWGHQVENPRLFVWSIDWASHADHMKFVHAANHDAFITGLKQVFDVEKVGEVFTAYTHWTSPASSSSSEFTAAMEAPVTEIGFFTLPNGSSASAKSAVEDALGEILDTVKTVGKASGSVIGWSSQPDSSDGNDEGGEEYLHGLFGYASIDAHMAWRATPEHARAGEIFADLERRGVSLEAAGEVPGVGRETGYFHVRFRRG